MKARSSAGRYWLLRPLRPVSLTISSLSLHNGGPGKSRRGGMPSGPAFAAAVAAGAHPLAAFAAAAVGRPVAVFSCCLFGVSWLLLLLLLLVAARPARAPTVGLNAFDSAHIDDADRSARRRCTLAYLLDVGRGERAAGILSERRLLPVERNRSRRRSGARHHRPAQHVGWRTRSTRRPCQPGRPERSPFAARWPERRRPGPNQLEQPVPAAHLESPGGLGRKCLAELP